MNQPRRRGTLVDCFTEATGCKEADSTMSVLIDPDLKLLPRAYVATCGADILRDDGILLVEELRKFG